MNSTGRSSSSASSARHASTWRLTAGSATAGSPKDRLALCKAFIAKAVWDFPTTRDLIDAVRHRPTLRRLCGWETIGEIPGESTFSRAFADFAEDQLPQRIRDAMIKARYADKIAGHISRDATTIHAREKAARKEPKPVAQPVEGADPILPEPTRLQRQLERTQDDNIADLPRGCDWCTKRDSKGKKQTCRVSKLHVDTMDVAIPMSSLVTSASLHASDAAMYFSHRIAGRVTRIKEEPDGASAAQDIRQLSASLVHVALMDHTPRRGEQREFAAAEAIGYRHGSIAERVHYDMGANQGGRPVRVRVAVKVAAHLSFGLLVIAAEQLLTMLCCAPARTGN